MERGSARVNCLAQEQSTPARARTQTTHSGVECTSHKATAPPVSHCIQVKLWLFLDRQKKGSQTQNYFTILDCQLFNQSYTCTWRMFVVGGTKHNFQSLPNKNDGETYCLGFYQTHMKHLLNFNIIIFRSVHNWRPQLNLILKFGLPQRVATQRILNLINRLCSLTWGINCCPSVSWELFAYSWLLLCFCFILFLIFQADFKWFLSWSGTTKQKIWSSTRLSLK